MGPAPAAPGSSETKPTVRKAVRVFPSMMRREFAKKRDTTPFLIWVSFLISFLGSRLYVTFFGGVGRGADSGGTRDITFEIGRNVIVGGYHIHHIAFGILLLLVAGWLALHYRGRQIARTSAIMYGIGLGFIVDETGFIVGGITPYRGDNEVFFIAVVLAGILFSAIYAPAFWRAVRDDLGDLSRLLRSLPTLSRPRREVARSDIDRDLERRLGPVPHQEDAEERQPREPRLAGGGPTASAPHEPTDAPPLHVAHAHAAAHEAPYEATAAPPRESDFDVSSPSARGALFERLAGKVVEVLLVIIFIGLLLGLADMMIDLYRSLLGVSVERLMQPILTGVLTILIGVELMRAMVEYIKHNRIMLPFLVDAGILLGLRELASELFRRTPDAILVAVIGGLLFALGGLRVILVRSMHDLTKYGLFTGGPETKKEDGTDEAKKEEKRPGPT
ncbi:MAG: phosphate-starvation-inducible PsiE family protein [Euryarchaeota archaeon]|nr:phosphate-starvation-inducible PsiE family protein [Euryarchaeota archaeon]